MPTDARAASPNDGTGGDGDGTGGDYIGGDDGVGSLTTAPEVIGFPGTPAVALGFCGRVMPVTHVLESARALARLSGSCHRLGWLERFTVRAVVVPLGAACEVNTAEALAVNAAVLDLLTRGGGRVGFKFAGTELDDDDGEESGIPGSGSILSAWARLSRRHPHLILRIDAHCGPTAPSLVARRYSRRRGLSVAVALAKFGGRPETVRVIGWGKCVARLAASSTHPHADSARSGVGWAEIFAHLPSLGQTLEFPLRPDYYQQAGGYSPPLLAPYEIYAEQRYPTPLHAILTVSAIRFTYCKTRC